MTTTETATPRMPVIVFLYRARIKRKQECPSVRGPFDTVDDQYFNRACLRLQPKSELLLQGREEAGLTRIRLALIERQLEIPAPRQSRTIDDRLLHQPGEKV